LEGVQCELAILERFHIQVICLQQLPQISEAISVVIN
jgi:hypothetical protein